MVRFRVRQYDYGLGLDCTVRVRVGFRYTVLDCRKCTQGLGPLQK